MKKIVTIVIEVDMKSEQSKEWHRPSDYFECTVKDTLEVIRDGSISNYSDKLETDTEKSLFKIKVRKLKQKINP